MAKKKTSTANPLAGYIPANVNISNPSTVPQTAYTQSYLEWALKNRPQVFTYDAVTSGSVTLYEVPQGSTLMITSAYLMGANSSAVASTVIRIETNLGKILAAFVPLAVAGSVNPSVSLATSFPLPIKIPGGTIISLVGNATVNSLTIGGFVGFLEYLE